MAIHAKKYLPWDLKIFGFIDSQFVTGLPLQDMFPHTWVQNFHKKDYQFELLPKRIRPKRKLKIKNYTFLDKKIWVITFVDVNQTIKRLTIWGKVPTVKFISFKK